MSVLPTPEPTGFLTVTDEGEDCVCCNGQGDSVICDCTATFTPCGIQVRCFHPRSRGYQLPSRPPFRVRIVRVDLTTGDVLEVVYGPVENSDFVWQPEPGTTGQFRAQFCCQEPPAGQECEWLTIGSAFVDNYEENCPLYVAVIVCVTVNTCEDSVPETVKIYAEARSNCKLTRLDFDGESVLPSSAGTLHRVVADDLECSTFGNACGPSETSPIFSHPSGPDNVKQSEFVLQLSPITEKTEWCVIAEDACGNFRQCCVDVPCYLKHSHLRVEIPAFSTNTADALLTRQLIANDLTNTLNDANCVASLKNLDTEFAAVCSGGVVPDFVSLVFIETEEVEETFTGFSAASVFFKRTPGSELDLCTGSAVIGTGTYTFDYKMRGQRMKVDYTGLANKLFVDAAAYHDVTITYPVTFVLALVSGGFVINAVLADPTIVWDSNCRWLRRAGNAFVSSDCSETVTFTGLLSTLVASGYFVQGASPGFQGPRTVTIATSNPYRRPFCNELMMLNWTSPRFDVATFSKAVECSLLNRNFVKTGSGIFVIHPGNEVAAWTTITTNSATAANLGNTYTEWVAL